MREALWAELLKARRSRLPWITVAAFVVAPAVGGLFMFVLADPSRARAMGLLGTKAQLVGGSADWPSYLALLGQMVAVGGAGVFGLIVIWLFGREYSDRAVKDLLALPTSRTAIVAAKFALAGVWCLLLAGQTYVLGLGIGAGLRLPGWSAAAAVHGLGVVAVTAVMVFAVVAPFAWVASVGRGYLAAVGVMLAAVVSAQIVAALGYGQFFPWAVPALYAGVAGPGQPPPGPVGYLFVVAVGVAGVLGTGWWWRSADHTT